MRSAVKRIIVLSTAAAMLSGCDLLAAAIYPELDPLAPPFGTDPFVDPFGDHAYDAGSATLEVTQGGVTRTIALDRIGIGSTYDESGYAFVTWEGGDGWSLSINAVDYPDSDASMPGVIQGDVMISRSTFFDFWIAGTYIPFDAGNSCALNVWVLSAEKLEGRANCTDLRWVDATSFDEEPPYVDGQDPFEISITFQATSSGDSVTS